jgi:uncharacterized protein
MLKINLTMTFDRGLRTLLHPAQRSRRSVIYELNRRTSIKDLIESLRIPHTEIGNLIVNGLPVDFSYGPRDGDRVRALSQTPPVDPCRADLLRSHPLRDVRFIVDVNVAKLGSLLRMAGFDCICRPGLDDPDIAETAVREGRILLSRDRNLLKRKIVIHGHLVRTQFPDQQLLEILRLYGLRDKLRPFTRCMKCNTPLLPINKDAVLHRLEPLTRKFYDTFFHCRGCDSIYWSGSHKTGMGEIIAKAVSCLPPDSPDSSPSAHPTKETI